MSENSTNTKKENKVGLYVIIVALMLLFVLGALWDNEVVTKKIAEFTGKTKVSAEAVEDAIDAGLKQAEEALQEGMKEAEDMANEITESASKEEQKIEEKSQALEKEIIAEGAQSKEPAPEATHSDAQKPAEHK